MGRIEGLTRRAFLGTATAGAVAAAGLSTSRAYAERPPNVVLIITDDQGYADLGCHGNPHVKTPHLDALHAESARLNRFYVMPVCSPTRACLMTGRYNYRTGVVDTYIGRSMMHPDEVTLPELLRGAGYRTGIFGKWHLGDNYPLRAMDQGFEEALVHNGGGIGQPSDPPETGYFDPILTHNGARYQAKGYCTDVFTDAAIAFIERHRNEPFFAYLATNAPHSPLIVADEYADPYRAMGLPEDTAKIYGMITNIDDNIGKLRQTLADLGLAGNTIVIFMTDNGGTVREGYTAGQRGLKGSVYEGGIRVPCFVHWPARIPGGRDVGGLSAHIDLMPTLLDACGVPLPGDRPIDGQSLFPALAGTGAVAAGRTVFAQWHRGDVPEPFRNAAVITDRYKLVDGEALYDLLEDPGEERDIAAEYPGVAADLRQRYEVWFAAMAASRGYDPPRIHVGTPHENPVTLTRQDWRGAEGWGDNHLGHWEILVAGDAAFDITLRVPPAAEGAEAVLRCAGVERRASLTAEQSAHTFDAVPLPQGPAHLEAWVAHAGAQRGVRYVDLHRRE